MVYRTLIQKLYTFQNQIECNAYWDSLEIGQVSVWLPDPRHLSRKQLLFNQQHSHDKGPLVLGSIHCYDTLSLDLISTLATEASAIPTNMWWRLLVHGCHLASDISSFGLLLNRKARASMSSKPPTLALRLELDPNYIQYSWQRINMIGYRFSWRVAVKEDMMAFASVYFSVLGGAYSSLGKANQKYAFKAGALAKRQIKLARWLQDAELECKCWLYYAEDMVMQGRFKKASRILNKQRLVADRLQNNTLMIMCDSVHLKWQTATTTTIPPLH